MNIEEKIEKLKIILPPPSKSLGTYIPAVKVGNSLYLSGVVPMKNGKILQGKFGKEFNTEDGKEIAEICALQLIANLKNTLKNLNEVKQIIRIQGFVNSTNNFTDQAKVMNAASELFVTIFGEKGRHSRIAVGVNALPANAALEISAVVEI